MSAPLATLTSAATASMQSAQDRQAENAANRNHRALLLRLALAMMIPAMLVGRIIFPCRSHVAAAGASD
jgi:hypothetical protein